jgi:hypothetical protein
MPMIDIYAATGATATTGQDTLSHRVLRLCLSKRTNRAAAAATTESSAATPVIESGPLGLSTRLGGRSWNRVSGRRGVIPMAA